MRTLTLLLLGSLAFAGETAQDSATLNVAAFEKDRRWVVVDAKIKVSPPAQAVDAKGNVFPAASVTVKCANFRSSTMKREVVPARSAGGRIPRRKKVNS